MDRARWPAALLRNRTRAHWRDAMEGSDAGFAAVLAPGEAPGHPHDMARGGFVDAFGIVQPAPVPRYSASPARPPTAAEAGRDAAGLLRDAGFDDAEAAALLRTGAVRATAGAHPPRPAVES